MCIFIFFHLWNFKMYWKFIVSSVMNTTTWTVFFALKVHFLSFFRTIYQNYPFNVTHINNFRKSKHRYEPHVAKNTKKHDIYFDPDVPILISLNTGEKNRLLFTVSFCYSSNWRPTEKEAVPPRLAFPSVFRPHKNARQSRTRKATPKFIGLPVRL